MMKNQVEQMENGMEATVLFKVWGLVGLGGAGVRVSASGRRV